MAKQHIAGTTSSCVLVLTLYVR